MASTWRNRITGYGEVSPAELLPNKRNWRLHPKAQQDALVGVLSEVGVVQNIIVNQRTGRMIDGHLRVEMALKHKQPSVPVTYVDLSDAEECSILATLDPLSSLAETDAEMLSNLMVDFSFENSAVNDMLANLLSDDNNPLDDPPAVEPDEPPALADDGEATAWPTITVRVPPSTLQLYRGIQEMLSGSDESTKFVDLINRAASTL